MFLPLDCDEKTEKVLMKSCRLIILPLFTKLRIEL